MQNRKKIRYRKFLVPEYIKKALETLKPPEDISVSEFAEKYRILDNRSATPGPWHNSKTPYLMEIMDCLCDPDIEEIIFVKPTQVGGTEALLNMLAYIVCQDPAPTMAVYPSDDLGERVVTNRIRPMIYAAKPLLARYKPNESSKSELYFDGMSIGITGSNSPSQLSSFAIRFLFLDEVDKYPGASQKESDPISLARERTKTYRNRRKIYMTSTPTLKTGHIWKALEGADMVKHYFVPCPHCGKYIELKWQYVKFPGGDTGMSYADRAEFATYVCQECGSAITDQQKPQMLRNGEWRVVEQNTQFTRKVAYWINTLYSPFVRFSEMAKEFLMSKDDPDAFQNFTNSWLAEPWEDTKLKTNADLVLERQTELPELSVPSWAKVLTAGVDVQETSVYWVIRAWGNYLTSQNIAHGQAANFSEVERIMNLQYIQEDSGEPMVVALALIDSGDNTDTVYDFCSNNSDWAMPSKGSSHPMDTHFRLSKINRTDSKAYGMPLAIIDTGKYKDMIAGRMRKENGVGSWMVFSGCDREYAEQVTAEHKVNVKTAGGRIAQSWVLKTSHGDNHFLDCEVYAMCAADMLGARTFHLQEVEVQPRTEVKPEPEPMPEETWIGENENWI